MPRYSPPRPALSTRAGRFVFLLVSLSSALAAGLPADLRAQAAGAVHGRVSDARGLPVAGAVVRVEPGAGRAVTDPDGRWSVHGLAPGAYRVVASAPGLADAELDVRVPREGESARADLALAPAARLDEVLTIVDRAPPADAFRRVLRRDEIERAGSLPASLERVPGVFIKAYGPGGARFASMRGADAEATLVLWGGERLLAAGGGAVDLSRIPPAAIDSVEVVLHGASSRWGAGALGGVIRLHPAAGALPAGHTVEASAGAGSLGLREASARVGAPLGRGGLVVAAEGGAYDQSYARSENADGLEGGATVALALPKLGLSGTTALHASERGAPGPLHAPSPHARISSERLLAALTAAGRAAGTWGVRGEAAFQLAQLQFTDAARPAFASDSRETSLALRAGAGRDVGLHRVDGGVEIRRHAARSTALAVEPVRWEVGVAAGGRWSPAGVRALALSPAVRVDAVRLDGGATRRDDLFLSPGLTVAWEVGDGLALTAFAGRSFRHPTFESLFFLSGVAVRSNPGLREERSRDVEAGIAWRGPGGLSGTLSAFDRRIEGAIVWLPDFQFVWSPRNLPRAIARGAELQVEWRRAGWELVAAWTHAPARFDLPRNENPLPYRPADQGRLEASLRGGDLRAAAEARFTGRRYPNVAGTNALGSYVLVDLTGAWERPLGGGELGLELRLENVLDRSYDVVFGFPAAGRTLHAGLRYRMR